MRPPAHRIDALPIVISEKDSAWDHKRVQAEIKILKDEAIRHPYVQYHLGNTRYDLGAELTLPDGSKTTVLPYVDLPQAWQFHGRRLTWQEVLRLQPMLESNRHLAYAEAFRLGLVKVEGPSVPEIDRDALGVVTDETIQAFFDVRPGLPGEIGKCFLQASMALTEPEKKA